MPWLAEVDENGKARMLEICDWQGISVLQNVILSYRVFEDLEARWSGNQNPS
jgi:hypothetical protein